MYVTCVWIQLYGSNFYKRERPYYPLEHALYSSFSHCTWTALSMWISICILTTGYGKLYLLYPKKHCNKKYTSIILQDTNTYKLRLSWFIKNFLLNKYKI